MLPAVCALRRFVLLAVLAGTAVLGISVPAESAYPGMPAKVERILEQDWCRPASYARARRVAPTLNLTQWRNLFESGSPGGRVLRPCARCAGSDPL